MPSRHALLAPSSSKRWMTCAPSARLEAQFPEKDTAYTREGTLAHSLCETLLDIMLHNHSHVHDADTMRGYVRGTGIETDVAKEGLDFEDMYLYCYDYAATVFEEYLTLKATYPDARLLIEAELVLDAFIPEGFGSSDSVIIAGPILHVWDFKYGKGVTVNAEGNTQMMCYALGALMGPAELDCIEEIRMTIHQPRLSHISSWTVSTGELTAWATETLRPAALAAWEGKGELRTGDHCRFCAAAAQCPALAQAATATLAATEFPELLDDTQLSDLLGKLDTLESWISRVREYALNRMLDGHQLDGWKVVEGRSLRRFSDPEKVVATLRLSGYEDERIFRPRELRTLGDIEKMLGKATFAKLLASCVEKPQGKPAIAPESDRREAFKPQVGADYNNLL